MPFVFSKNFFILLLIGFIPLSLSWNYPFLRWLALGYDLLLLGLVLIDWRISRLPNSIKIERIINNRFAIGDANEIVIEIVNESPNTRVFVVKDEFPPQMELEGVRQAKLKVASFNTAKLIYNLKPARRGKFEFGRIAVRYLSNLQLIWCQIEAYEKQIVKVYPNIRRAREVELAALGAQSIVAAQRKSVRRGEGRDFESLREYVRGDELRHLSWTATARRGKLVTRQYQIERDQTILIALDAGRLMTGRIGNETKFDSSVQATLTLMSAAARGGDNVGVTIFGRKTQKFLPPKRGTDHFEAVLEALHDVEPEMIEPSYSRAFEFIAGNLKKRSLIVVLTDLIDEEGSKELINALKLLRPRHLPVIVTIADRDLRTLVEDEPGTVKELFVQSVAEEILQQREVALKKIEALGGLALDVNTRTLAPSLLETYLRVKERGLL